MSSASHTFDPVGAAQDDISRSKHLIASTLDELTRHHSWLESYHRAERRRAQRLSRQEAFQRLKLRRQRTAWLLRRFTLISFAAMRSTAIFLVRNGSAFLVAARKFTLRATAWTAPRVYALAVVVLRSLSAGLFWSLRTALSLARMGFAGASIGFAWSVRTSDVLGVALRRRLSAGFALLWAKAAILTQPMRTRASVAWLRTRFRSRRIAAMVQTRLSANWSWMRSSAPGLARNLVRSLWVAGAKLTSDSWARAASQARRLLEKGAPRCRALVAKQCTALILIEPCRARLPVVRES